MDLANYFRQLFTKAKQQHWERQRYRQLKLLAQNSHQLSIEAGTALGVQHLILICEEFFHPDLRGYGGFGRAAKNVSDHLNKYPSGLRCALAYPTAVTSIQQSLCREYHGVPVVMRPYENPPSAATLGGYASLLHDLLPRVIMSIDWHPSYEVPAHALPDTPLIIWVRDPRDRKEWEKIAAVPDELRFRGVEAPAELVALAHKKELSIKRLYALQRNIPRKIIFAVKARSLVLRAERTYGVNLSNAYYLPTPIDIPILDSIEQTERPSLLYLGRLDAVKRPWIAFELARRHPEIDFFVAGYVHNTELMETWLTQYRHLPNLKLLGHVDGEGKDRLLRSCWALLNTSVHEAEPVSFLEALSYGKCILSCCKPDIEIADFVYYSGEIPGEGLDESSLQRFDKQIAYLLQDDQNRLLNGHRGREEMIRQHSFEIFQHHFQSMLSNEGII
ncbi:glycosyltransferase [Ferribacterium limneticum]|uniref:glycosyltransferase n=1 Tax=Ferribacterium limneticum TaxID=76259 RepID=UPI001CF93844|nr:glycosyltransferase [Ferribacterium limneticum]UCV17316.1 glycosyltransferase [Ferribacterium limneticum]